MVFKLVEKLASTSLGSIPSSNVSRSRTATKATRNKRKPGLIPAYERWLIPGCTLWIVDIDNQSSHGFTLSFLSEEESQGADLSLNVCIMVRSENTLDSSFQQKFCTYVSDAREVPTTVINGKGLSSGQEVELLPGDSIMFGRTSSFTGVEFKLVEVPLKFCLSSKSSEKNKGIDKEALQSYGIEFSTEWQPDTTHLLMDQFRVTSKIFQCLALRRPVVTYQWVMAAVDVYLNSEGSDFPSVAEYLPAPDVPSAKNRLNVTDASILLPNEARATILGGSFGFTCPGPEVGFHQTLLTSRLN
ncbi:hypothetical protein DSO57_1020520 [Entomophthora muscae]|uniref:Uncharacterized protein n=1 Tax=Entomophthora muscae TaxID=34485 RepID=A0ACC2S5J3_9FUNG|nr:hypothetical protein DSO57_1020520 [Entomophthora muscae]